MKTVPDAPFADALARVDNLDLEDQAELLELLRKRVAAARRKQLVRDIANARADFRAGRVNRGSAADLKQELRGK